MKATTHPLGIGTRNFPVNWPERRRAARARVAWAKLQAGRITDARSVAALKRDYAAEFAQFAKEGGAA